MLNSDLFLSALAEKSPKYATEIVEYSDVNIQYMYVHTEK